MRQAVQAVRFGRSCEPGDGGGADVCLGDEHVAVKLGAEPGAVGAGGENDDGRGGQQRTQSAGDAEPSICCRRHIYDHHFGMERPGGRQRVMARIEVGNYVGTFGAQQGAEGCAGDLVIIDDHDPQRIVAATRSRSAGSHTPTIPAWAAGRICDVASPVVVPAAPFSLLEEVVR